MRKVVIDCLLPLALPKMAGSASRQACPLVPRSGGKQHVILMMSYTYNDRDTLSMIEFGPADGSVKVIALTYGLFD
ncbi:MAG: hypothetical protein HWN68_07820 [Desulfobacterales bacterium]|nr:hypothetical protein [Desulfobacterales bacterium]